MSIFLARDPLISTFFLFLLRSTGYFRVLLVREKRLFYHLKNSTIRANNNVNCLQFEKEMQ